VTVSLLLHGDGANGSTTIVDSSGSPKTPTAYGNAQISTAQSLFGGASIKFDGAGDYLEYAPHADFDFGAGDFTLECDVYFTGWPVLNGTSTYGESLICRDSGAAGQRIFAWYITGTASSLTTIQFFGFDAADTFEQINASYSFALNTHYRLRLVRSGNLVYFFVNGTLLNAGGTTFTKTLKTATTPLRVGALRGAGETVVLYLNGYLDEVRISKGEALSTASYTPPTAAYPDEVPAPVDNYTVKPIVYLNEEIRISSGFQGGTATSATYNTLTDSAKAFTVNAMVNRVVWITAGTGVGQSRVIASNTATVLTLLWHTWDVTPDATSTFVILYRMSDIIAALPTYAAWRNGDANGDHVTFTAPIRLLSGGALSTWRETMEFTTSGQTLWTDNGSYFQAGVHVSEARTDVGYGGGALVFTTNSTGWLFAQWKGKMRWFGTAFIYNNRHPTTGTGALVNYAVSTGDGIEMYSTVNRGVAFNANSANDKFSRCSFVEGGLLIASNAQITKCIGSLTPRNDGTLPAGVGPNGVDIIDAVYAGPSADMVMHQYTLDHLCTAYLWNPLFSKPATSAFQWNDAGDGVIYTGALVEVAITDTAGAAVSGTNVGVFDVNGDGAILNSKGTNKVPVRIEQITTDVNGTYEGVVGTGEGLPIVRGKYTYASTYVSTELLYGPFVFRVRKYGYQFLQKAADWTERSKEQITLNTNIFVVASESVAALIAGVAIDGTAKTITLSAARTLQELYDYSQSWAATTINMVYDECLTTADGNNVNLPATWTLIPANYLDYGSNRINGGTLRFDTAGTYAPKVGDTMLKFTAASGTYNLAGADITGTVTLVNTGGGLITVSLAPGVSYVNTGPNITVEQVLNESLAITNLVPGSTVYVVTDNGTVIANEVVAGTSTSYALTSGNTAGATYLTVRVRKATGSPAYQPWQTQTANLLSQSLFVQQNLDE